MYKREKKQEEGWSRKSILFVSEVKAGEVRFDPWYDLVVLITHISPAVRAVDKSVRISHTKAPTAPVYLKCNRTNY